MGLRNPDDGITVTSELRSPIKGDPTNLFYSLFVETSRRGHFWVPPFKELEAKINAFGKNALIFLAYPNNVGVQRNGPSTSRAERAEPIAGALVLIHDHTAYYIHAGSTAEGQKLEAPYLLIWEIIKKAKSLGCTKLDLEGIYDERFPKLTKNWQGFTVFKKKFGGEELTFPGAYTRYL